MAYRYTRKDCLRQGDDGCAPYHMGCPPCAGVALGGPERPTGALWSEASRVLGLPARPTPPSARCSSTDIGGPCSTTTGPPWPWRGRWLLTSRQTPPLRPAHRLVDEQCLRTLWDGDDHRGHVMRRVRMGVEPPRVSRCPRPLQMSR